MRVTTAMLADAARVGEDDTKLYVHGGAWDRIWTRAFPTTHPTLALALVVEVDYDEALTDHHLVVELTKDGVPSGPRAEGQFAVGHPPRLKRGAPTYVPLALVFNMVTFEEPGRHEWIVTIDDDIRASVPLEVDLSPPG